MQAILDSSLSFDEAIEGTDAPAEIIETLALIDVAYLSFDGREHKGQLLVHRAVSDEVMTIFEELLSLSFPILKCIPIATYGWDDEASMRDNNSSSFNYRTVFGTGTLSNHSYGLALDINPLYNPYEQPDGQIVPLGGSYDPARPGTFASGSLATRAFLARGWDWGGLWERKDWQHFARKA